MNEVFIIGEVIEEIQYKFMIKNGKTAKATIKLKLLDKTKLEIIAYNKIADYCLQKISLGDVIIVHGRISDNVVEVKSIEISK